MPTSQISINYGYGYTFRTGGGTPAPPLVAGANPPAQYAASGTTTLTFAFPAATGGTGPIVYAPPTLTAPPGSTASVSGTAPGNITINNAANGEGYLIRVYATDADGQQVLNDAIGAVEEAVPSSLVPGANPAEQYVAAGTSSISFTFNAASGGTAPLSYGAPVLIAPPGSTASVSGTAPGVVTINNAADEEAYLVRVYVTDGSGQQVLNDALASVAPAAPVPLVAGANPPAQYAAAGTTALTFAFPAAAGGTGPIVYAPPTLTAPPGSTASVSGTAPGNITINNAANGEGYLIRVYATDADGQQVLNDAIGAVEDAAPSSLVPGANPPEQYVAAGTSSISFTFNAASGGVAPLSYGAPVLIAPPGSTASVSGTAPGVVTINNAADEEAYLVRVYVTDGSGQQVLNDALASVAPAAPVPLVAGANPPAQYAASGTSTLTFAFPAASGGAPPYTYASPILVKPPGSTATISGAAPGNITINGAVDTDAYLIRVVITDAGGQQVLNDALGSIGEATFVPLAPILAPQRQALASNVTSASVTFTQPGAPPGMIYSASFADVTNGLAVTPSSGSGLGAYAFPVGSGKDYISIIAGTAPDGQVSTAVAQVAVAAAPVLSWAAPAAAVTNAGVTSAAITWNTATGGKAPYVYGAAGAVYDSQAASTTAVLSTVGTPGTTTVSGLVNGQVVVVERSVKDAAGNVITVQGSVTVAATAAGVTPGAAPAAQTLASDVTIATIGTWGAPSGGTGPYTYAVTEISNGGTLVAGSGLGVWQVSGLTSGFTFVFLLTVTDSLGAKGYSVTTISVEPVLDVWEELDDLDFTDADWTAVSTTSTVASSVAWYLVLYAADGVTPRAYVYNNNTEARTLSLTPSGTGLTLVNGAITVQPTVGVWPAGWTAMIGGSRRDAWLIEAIVGGEEPAGALGFVHIFDVSTNTVTAASTPGTGLRNINSGTNTQIRVISYIGGAAEQIIQAIPPSLTRSYTCGVQVTIADSRREDVYVRTYATDYGSPQSGQRVRVQATSTAMTAPGANVTTSASWFASTIADRTKFWLYHDGSATVGSRVRLLKLRLLRKINGSL